MNWPTFGRIMCHLPRSGDRRLHAPRLEHLRKLRCILVDEEKKPSIKLDADEKELLASVERGEWKSAAGGTRERARYSRYAKATFRKDRPLNIRLSRKDLEAIQKRACAEGLPSQTLISSLLYKYASGRLNDV